MFWLFLSVLVICAVFMVQRHGKDEATIKTKAFLSEASDTTVALTHVLTNKAKDIAQEVAQAKTKEQ
jgi:hypothetical protein